MSLMSTPIFLGYADRIAKQYSYVKVAFDTLSNSGNGTLYYDRMTGTDDPDIELTMLQPAYNADNYFNNSGTYETVKNMSSYVALITAFESHLAREGSITTRKWDDYCAQEDVRVSDYTNQVYYARNGVYMNARNVFCEDDETFATLEMTGASTLSFADGADFGDGASANKANGENFAGSQMKAVVTGSNTITSLVINIEGLDEEGAAKTLSNVTIAGAPGAEVSIGASSDKWVDITNVTLVSGGVTGDQFELHNVKEREIAL